MSFSARLVSSAARSPGFSSGGAGGDADIDPHLVGNDAAEGGLAQAGRAVKQDVIQGFPPHFGGLDKDLQVALWPSPARYTPAGSWGAGNPRSRHPASAMW